MDLNPYRKTQLTARDNPLHMQNYTRETYCPRCGERARHQIIANRGAWWQLKCITCGTSFQVRSEGRKHSKKAS